MSPQITYQILDLKISLLLPVEIDINLLSKHIPEIKKIPFDEIEEIFIGFKEEEKESFLYDEESILICGTWNDTLYNDIPHLLYSLVRRLLIEKKYFPIHSTMIEDKLYIAHSGAGKTTLADKAMSLGKSVNSLDKTIVKIENDKLIKKLGTDIFSRRYGDSEIIKVKNNIEIKAIYLFFVSDNFSIKQLSNSEAIHSLYPFFMDTVKKDCIVNNKFIYSTDVKGDFYNFIRFFHTFDKVFIITGNYEEILNGKNNE